MATDLQPSTYTKICPHCGKEIKVKADLCKYCRRDVSPAVMAQAAAVALANAGPHPETKTCPHCAEEIKWDARVCKHCQRDLRTGQTGATVYVQPTVQWNRGIAAVLSLLIPGAGQIYKGQIFNGLLWLFVVVVGYMMLIWPGLILHMCCILGAASGDPYKGQQATALVK